MPPTRAYHSPRREQDAADTRNDILRAARELFSAQGYARVTVADIARRAGVATKTVYASAGGKAGIFTELIKAAVIESGAAETLAAIRRTGDPREAIAVLARGTRNGNETKRDIIDMLYAAMPVHDDAGALWEEATESYRSTLREVADHLHEIGGLGDGLDPGRAADVLWLCFGMSSWRTLVGECGWTWDEAERWLSTQAVLLLRHGLPGSALPS
ncbi:hypothetical protein Pth03_23060 [Planotetraspora thailandica]|uniref:HTH tetR-type domain-containing protein n=1 Tax=Planotetraspora thailandica TaxID=487172 RepID=A0A8J3XT34_9ACTN|nr:TetR/AcrR family transcriptional regulator [Planotetraspora thailandica]GII53917.1 hypothetical protein Pth03_23060 [Planotetraspora thailandica]